MTTLPSLDRDAEEFVKLTNALSAHESRQKEDRRREIESVGIMVLIALDLTFAFILGLHGREIACSSLVGAPVLAAFVRQVNSGRQQPVPGHRGAAAKQKA